MLIDMQFMASNTNGKNPMRPLDSQEFGFASNLVDSSEVAPADELFFKGQLLPLQLDHRLHLVQALSSSSCQVQMLNTRVGSSRLATYDLCQIDDDATKFHSCRLEREVSLDYLKDGIHSSTSENHMLLSSKESSPRSTRDDELKRFMNDAMTDPESSSFHSANSGFWDSGTDKDMMDSSSSRDSSGSSQDSYFHTNQTHITEAPPLINKSHHHHHHPHSKPRSFSIPWRLSLWRKSACKKHADSLLTFSKMGFSEDLSKCKASAIPPLNEVQEALLPWKLPNGLRHEKQGKHPRRLHPCASNDGCHANVMKLCKSSNMGSKKSSLPDGSTSFRMQTKGIGVGGIDDDVARMQRSAAMAAKERWQMCARRLKRGWIGMDECGKRAYFEVEHGSMICSSRPAIGQMQRSLSDPAINTSNALTAAKSRKPTLQKQKQANGCPCKVLAMSSCPSSTISSPNPSGVLAVLNPNQRITTSAAKSMHCRKNSNKSSNHPLKGSTASPGDGACIPKSSIESSGNANNGGGSGNGNNYRSISTMQELHSSLQGAIAHCKESNKKVNYGPNYKYSNL